MTFNDLSYSITTQIPWWAFWATIVMFTYFSSMLLKQIFFAIKSARYIRDTPTSLIRSASQGYVELEGQALPIPIYQQLAPLTYKPCCWYSFKVEEFITRQRENAVESWWDEVISGTSPHLFLLRDATGVCVVSPLGAEIITNHRLTWESRTLPQHLQIQRNSGERLFRFTESRIEAQDELYVLGHFETVRGQSTLHHQDDYDPEKPKKSTSNIRNFFFPQSQDIKTANKEWESLQAAQSQEAEPSDIHLIRDNPSTGQPYLISNYSQKKLAWKYHLQALGYTLFFLIIVAIPLTLLMMRFPFAYS